MAITKVKNYDIDPYYDDYDETKNYHRIMFRPGFAVQARELTQLQTALYSQLDKLGQYTFNDGSRVLGGKVTINTQYEFIKLTSTSTLSAFVGNVIEGSVAGVKAKVLAAVAASGGDPDTLYIKYETGGTANATQTFANGETITDTNSKAATLAASASTGTGSAASIEEGVYFISGTYVYVAPETIILDKYTNTPSYIIGLSVTESYNIDSSADASLADRALGTPNYAAPGAHRYKIATALIKESITAPNTTYANYIILLKIDDGIIQSKDEVKQTNTELTDRLARRTHEESGDYAVTPYQLDIREHLDDGAGNGGYLLTGEATQLAVGVEPATSYVQGYRVENLATQYFAIDKPRGHQNEVNNIIDTPVGNYVKVTQSTARGMPDINNFITATLADGGGNIGTCRIKGYEEGTSTLWYLYLFDIVMDAGESFSTVTTITQDNPDANHQDFTATLAPTGRLFSVGDDSLVYKLPYNGVRTLLAGSGPPTYKVRTKGEGIVSGTGNSATISFQNFGGSVDSTSDVLMSVGNTAPVEVPTGCVTTSNTTLTITNTDGDLNATGFHTGTPYVQVIWTVAKTAASLKTKTKANTTITPTYNSSSSTTISLGKYDIKKINSIKLGTIDVTDQFIVDNGQRPGYYGEGKLQDPSGSVGKGSNETITIDFDYYTHGAGDYFTVDSYASGEYETIPTFQGTQGTLELRDCIDFRPTKGISPTNASLAFTSGTGEQLSDMPKPNGSVTADISRYLGRIDKLIVTKEGEFQVITGVADAKPSAPDAPSQTMVLFELHAAPYVFGPKDLIPVRIDNKRYTMRDIGALNKRIKTLEYYTSLSLLEQEAANTSVFDGSTIRLNNGFIVDGFYGHNLGHITHQDYSCSIDKSRGILRPKFFEDNVNLVRYASDSGTVQKTGSLLTLPYGHAEWIKQPYATTIENVNPYNVFSWTGQIKLSPESDEWKDTITKPSVQKDSEGVYDQLVQMAEASGVIGTVWNEWSTNWTGEPVTSSTSTSTIVGQSGDWEWEDQGRQEVVTTVTTTTTQTGVASRSGLRTSVVPDTEYTELGEKVVETNFVPFIRSRKIYFKAELLKPFTKMYAFFNGRDVTDYCAEESFVEWSAQTDIDNFEGTAIHPTNTDLVSDATGKIEGSFIIPSTDAIKFKTGTRMFRLTDSSANNQSLETTSAEALYHAQGLLEVRQNTILATKVPKFQTETLNQNEAVTETSTQSTSTTTYVDPVAQTFVVDQLGGLFVTKLDLYVHEKPVQVDSEGALPPLNVSIRSVENGIPTQNIVPGTDIIVYPADINTSTLEQGGHVATTVTFDHPVYLAQDQEYAIVLISQSDDYKIFLAETGGFDLINKANRVTKQPYDGVFFTSANSSTWTPEQTKDLKFTLYRASFSATSGTATLVNDAIPSRQLPQNPFNYVSNSTNTVIRVNHPNHGMHGGSAKVTLSGFGTSESQVNGAVSSSTAVTLASTNSLIATGQTVTGHGISGTVTVSGISGTSLTLSAAQTITDGAVLTFAATSYDGLTATNVNTTHTIADQELDSYTITITGDASTSSGIHGGGTFIKATEDKQYNILAPQLQTLELPGTGISYSLEAQTGKSIDSSTQVGYNKTAIGAIQANGNNEFTDPFAIASTINESTHTSDSSAGNKSFVLTTTFSTISDATDTQYTYLSPVIDMNRASVITVANRLNNATSDYTDASAGRTFVADTVATGTSNENKYITKRIDLSEASDVLNVWLNVNRPGGSSIDLYYKVLDPAVEENFEEKAWTLATPTTPTYIVQNDRSQFSEVNYEIDPTGTFKSFAFKIVLTSTNSSNAPLVKDFRAIAST